MGTAARGCCPLGLPLLSSYMKLSVVLRPRQGRVEFSAWHRVDVGGACTPGTCPRFHHNHSHCPPLGSYRHRVPPQQQRRGIARARGRQVGACPCAEQGVTEKRLQPSVTGPWGSSPRAWLLLLLEAAFALLLPLGHVELGIPLWAQSLEQARAQSEGRAGTEGTLEGMVTWQLWGRGGMWEVPALPSVGLLGLLHNGASWGRALGRSLFPRTSLLGNEDCGLPDTPCPSPDPTSTAPPPREKECRFCRTSSTTPKSTPSSYPRSV